MRLSTILEDRVHPNSAQQIHAFVLWGVVEPCSQFSLGASFLQRSCSGKEMLDACISPDLAQTMGIGGNVFAKVDQDC